MMKKYMCAAFVAVVCTFAVQAQPKVFMIKEITPEALVRVYEALGVKAHGRVAVKISTGEMGGNNYLKPTLIRGMVDKVRGNLMDEYGQMRIAVRDKKHIKYDIVGDHLAHYDFMINLAHFKGHAMGGFGGVLKNQSIGVASTAGKAYIHTAGATDDPAKLWQNLPQQDAFLESMAAAAQAVADYFGKNIIYINVMNNMSVDCDCDSHPADPKLKDMGILASTDPVALDQACLDLVFSHKAQPGDDEKPLIERINRQHGTYITDYAEKIGLGSKTYKLVMLK